MTSSGTYAFDMSGGDLVVNAFAKCGKRRAEITGEMLKNAEMEANLLNVEMTNRNPHQFALEVVTQALAADTASYDLTTRIASVALVYVTNDSDDKCRTLNQISASRYATISDKTTTSGSGPTSFWINQAQTPALYIWPLIDSSDTVTYTANVLAFRQMEDFDIASGVTTDLPYRFLDVFAMGLAARLALMYAPDRAAGFEALYEKKFSRVEALDQEDVPLTFSCNMRAYT